MSIDSDTEAFLVDKLPVISSGGKFEMTYRVAQNHGKQVLRISHTILSFLDEIASASQQLPFFTRSAQLPLLSKVSCSDLFAHEE